MALVKNKPLVINKTVIQPGTRSILSLPIPNFYTIQNPLDLNVHVIHGKYAGPRLFVTAAIHGDELNGVEIVRRLLKHSALKRLRGTLLAIPIVNIFGIIQHSRYFPDRRDLNRCFPGSSGGALAARVAQIFMTHIVKNATHGIDLHTGANHRTNLPQIRANLNDPQTKRLAQAFQVPVILNSNLRDGSLREAASEYGIPMLLYEAGEALRFDELCIRAGVRGIVSVMRSLDMLPQSKRVRKSSIVPFIAKSSYWERAKHSGIFNSVVTVGADVREGDLLGIVSDPSDMLNEAIFEVRAKEDGIIIGKTSLPLVNEGDAIFHIARFREPEEVAAELENFNAREEYNEGQEVDPELEPTLIL